MNTLEPEGEAHSPRPRLERVALGLIAVLMLPASLNATFAPRSFFDDFPLGRSWIAHRGDVYNEHLVRDVGALFAALIIVTGWTAFRNQSGRGIAFAWLAQGVLHLTFHARHLEGYGAADKIGLTGSLALVPVLALVALWAGRSPRGAKL